MLLAGRNPTVWCLCEDGKRRPVCRVDSLASSPSTQRAEGRLLPPQFGPSAHDSSGGAVRQPQPWRHSSGQGLCPAPEGIMGALALRVPALALPPRGLRTTTSE